MSVTTVRSITIEMSGDVEYTQTFDSVSSTTSSGQNQLVSLTTGNNTITVPASAIGATIIPPVSNTTSTLVLKGVNGDTGITISRIDPCSISLASVSSFVINASAGVIVRIIYS